MKPSFVCRSASCVALVALLLPFFVTTAMAQPPAPPPETDQQVAKRAEIENGLANANSLFQQGRYEEAISACDTFLADGIRSPQIQALRAEAFTLQSSAHHAMGKFLASIDAAYLATLEKSDYLPAHQIRLQSYLAREDYDKAINTANRMIGQDDKNAIAYSYRGKAYFAKSNWGQAIADQTKAIELNGGLVDAFQRRAQAHLANQELPKAVDDLTKALQLNPSHAEALCDRGYLYGVNKNYAAAVADFDAAIASDPKLARAFILKGRALAEQKLNDEALACFDRAIEIRSDYDSHLYRAQHYQEIKRLEDAVKDYSIAIEKNAKGLAAYAGRLVCARKLDLSELVESDSAMVRQLTPRTTDKQASKSTSPAVDPGLARRFIAQSKPVNESLELTIKEKSAQIDALVQANYAKFDVQPNPLTADDVFVRRIYLDLVGRIPTLREVQFFLKSTSENKRSELIDSLLSSEGYASHQFNYWADVLRYKDDLNNSVRGEPFRQWLKQSLAENKPWNKMVYEMISSQGRIWDTPATGYLQRDPGMPLDVMNNTLRIFIGTRIGCAQCHNHPFDRWTQKEFYHMAAFTFGTLNNTHGGEKKFFVSNPVERLRTEFDEIEQEEEDRRNNSYRFDQMISNNMMVIHDDKLRQIRLPKDYAYDDAKPEEVVPPKTLLGKQVDIRENEPPRKAFARWLVENDNPRFAKTIANRLWKQVFGVGQFEPVDDITDDTEAENPELMAFLEAEMVRMKFDMKEFLRMLVNTQTYQRQACTEDLLVGAPYHFPGPKLRRMTAEQAWDSFVTLAVVRDDYREPKASLKAEALKLNFTAVTAQEVLESQNKGNQVDQQNNEFRNKFLYQGELIARASELPSPVPPNHFLRIFGQSDRELISASSQDGSVPQILFMLNGPISHMLLEKNSTIYINIMRKYSLSEGVKAAFLTCLSRYPDEEEMVRAVQEVKSKGPIGYGNVVWSLVNTREFLFIQ